MLSISGHENAKDLKYRSIMNFGGSGYNDDELFHLTQSAEKDWLRVFYDAEGDQTNEVATAVGC